MTPERLAGSVRTLGVTPTALEGLGCGWADAADLARWRAGFAGDGTRTDGAYLFAEHSKQARLQCCSKRLGLPPPRFGVSSAARAMLYRFAVETGFRAGEIRGLTRANLRLTGDKPSGTVPAAFAKNRVERTVPLKLETAAALAAFVAGKLPGAHVFKLPRQENFAPMIRGDLARADVPYEDDAGR
jgi:hypothetical protein